MQKITGDIFLLIGLAALIGGRKLSDQFGPQVQPIFTERRRTGRFIFIFAAW